MTTTKTFPAQLPIRSQIKMFESVPDDNIDLAIQMWEERRPQDGAQSTGYLAALTDFVSETMGSDGPSEIVLKHLITRRPICAVCEEELATHRGEIYTGHRIWQDNVCEGCIESPADPVYKVFEMSKL